MRALLELKEKKYPSLFFKENDDVQTKHPLYFQDDSKANCLHLAIKDRQIDICRTIIDKVGVYNLKTNPIEGNKTVLKFIETQEDCQEMNELKKDIKTKIGKKTGKRKGNKTDEMTQNKQLKKAV